jgi:hypothetical protein
LKRALLLAGIVALAVGVWTLSEALRQGGPCWDCLLQRHHHHRGDEHPARAALKTLPAAQADFRANDRDGNGVQDFWRGDVAGLYVTTPPGSKEMIKLIDISIARADAALALGITRIGMKAPKGGYWFKAIRNADEDPKRLDPNRFAFCAYPEDPALHRSMYVINEDNTVFRAPALKGGVEVFPDEKTLRVKWSKLD